MTDNVNSAAEAREVARKHAERRQQLENYPWDHLGDLSREDGIKEMAWLEAEHKALGVPMPGQRPRPIRPDQSERTERRRQSALKAAEQEKYAQQLISRQNQFGRNSLTKTQNELADKARRVAEAKLETESLDASWDAWIKAQRGY